MKYSLMFDKLGACKGCSHEIPGPSEILSVSACTWCERNPHLFRGIRDQYEKRKEPELVKIVEVVPDDSNPAKEANRSFLLEYGIVLDKQTKKPEDK